MLVRVPLLGVLVYGIAEASTAYLVTKITEPVPPPEGMANEKGGRGQGIDKEQAIREWCEGQTRWRNKKEFLNLPVEWLDKFTGGTGVEEVGSGERVKQGGVDDDAEKIDMRTAKQWPGGYVVPGPSANRSGNFRQGGGFTGGREDMILQ